MHKISVILIGLENNLGQQSGTHMEYFGVKAKVKNILL
jgi:hypothetical protein